MLKKDNDFMERSWKQDNFSEHEESLPPLRKSIETEFNENNFRHLHLLLSVFAADEVPNDKFL